MSKVLIPPMPNGLKWTSDQWKAIVAKDTDILVAAAAGSGKTAVLVERMIRKIVSADDPVDVDQLLVVTFTNASAAEMRNRIGEALEKAINDDPESRHLRRQLSLLNKASISTLHSFCLDVVRKYYYLIDVDPGFRIADETEAQLLRDEVMDALLEEEYGTKGNEPFFRLVDTFTSDRNDEALQEITVALYDFARSNPNPDKYLDGVVSMYDTSGMEKIEELPFIDALLFDIQLQLNSARQFAEKALEVAKLPDGPAAHADAFTSDIHLIDGLLAAANDSWESLYTAMQSIKFAGAATIRKGQCDEELKKKAGKYRDKVKRIVNGLASELFSRKPESFLHDMEEMKPVIETLTGLVRKFSDRFEAAKKEKGLVDFSDLEHYCLDILVQNEDEAGNLLPSAAALSYRDQFREVLVDEYQDTNMVQETILKLVSGGSGEVGNLFMVGDVKQSIYRFRLAEPNLFLGKYNRFSKDAPEEGLRIDLARNFRSRKEVLDATNYLFRQIMGVQVGEIEYGEDAELRLGADYPAEPFPVELIMIDQGRNSEPDDAETDTDSELLDAEELEQSQLEARTMAAKIKEIISSGQPVYDAKTKTSRPVRYRDIVILLRSMTWAPQIMEEFKQQGLPIYANLSTGYFQATEVAIMMSLLKMIDNPYQDVPLAAVLRSPIVGLDEEELAIIKLQDKKGAFWDSVMAFCKKNAPAEWEGLHEKVCRFTEQLEGWRTLARQGSLSELIWQLYRDTGFYDFAGGLPGGKQRQANLRALYDRGRQYEETSFRGLFRFLRFIERMMDRGDDLGAARALGEQEDVVRIMTIHSSKGLEFPVVFIAGIARSFNMMDIRKSYMLDKEFGFATKYINPEKRIAYPSLPQLAFKRKKRMEMLAEEMRVLYVAMTRAKEKLYLLATLKDADKKLSQWEDFATHPRWLLEDADRAAAAGYVDWIGPALFRHKDCGILRGGAEGVHIPAEIFGDESHWKVTMVNAEEISSLESEESSGSDGLLEVVRDLRPVAETSPREAEVIERLTWEYQFQDAASHRAKQTVSDMKRNRELADEESGTDLVKKARKTVLDRPRFMQEKALSPAERGTALHAVMQHVDLSAPITEDSIRLLVRQMVEAELLTEEQMEVIEPNLIVTFFQSDLGQRLLSAKKVYREVPFTASISSKEVYPDWKDENEQIFIQGIIDCLFEDQDGLVMIDFKSDQITGRFYSGFEGAAPILEDRYRLQIELYTRALEKIWKRRVNERYLFFFDGAHILKLERDS
ncbi:helicase-exonuclease AddAB subunit AddA [Neobacillus notoginsengisoli]|uniref:ATP-dependent helicase/nuclease subunit A n=1 Tax=Neobacillus notoginsengisoli TaxID=1578198 RepID=A0A417YZ23_9BACI|nr:helicase-exonuclease AddAB subunit AddA [Neobacillus notoginsengisoli]RHW43160.1 helicase-exonuclease AddAB subunit AddA [Neobacillus notoginsengisoli]